MSVTEGFLAIAAFAVLFAAFAAVMGERERHRKEMGGDWVDRLALERAEIEVFRLKAENALLERELEIVRRRSSNA